LNPALGGQTYYFGYPHDAVAAVSATERGFRFPYAGTIVAANATISVGGTVGAGHATTATIGIYNKTTATFTSFGFTGLNYASAQSSYQNSGLSIAVNTTNEYAFYVIVPSHTTAPTAVRHYANIFWTRT
jgi:hypothetical protein